MASTARRVIVVGLGIFGSNIVRELYENGFDVIAVDKDKEAVHRLKDFAAKAIVADGTDNDVMDHIGVQEDDVVIISFGEDLAASTLIDTFTPDSTRIFNVEVPYPIALKEPAKPPHHSCLDDFAANTSMSQA